ncbi:MAG: HD domain-containing protein, partial [Longimicrobiales bacterium]
MTSERSDREREERFARQLRFIVEIDNLKRVLRRTLITDGSRRENSAEHSWH